MVQKPDSCRSEDCCYDLSKSEPEKIEGSKTSLALFIVLPFIIGIILCIITAKLFVHLGKKGMKYSRAKMLFVQSFIAITWFGLTSWGVQSYVNPCTDFDLWLNGDLGVSFKSVIIGMMANVVFGFIDNAGLFFGGCYLDEVFALLPGSSDANVAAGYGNTFSDFLGAFLGTFVGLILKDATGVEEGPLWANAIGIIVGCLLGILVPKLILSNSSTKGLNKTSARQVLLGAMEIDELEAIIDGKKTLFDFRVERTFKKLDNDNSGKLEIQELKDYMMDAMGDDFDEKQFENELKEVFLINKNGETHEQEVDYKEFEQIYKKMAIDTLAHRKKQKQEEEEQQENQKQKQNLGHKQVAPEQLDSEIQNESEKKLTPMDQEKKID